MNAKKVSVAAALALGAWCAFGDDEPKTWEWTQSSPGAAAYDTGANWKGGTAPANYGVSSDVFLNNQETFVFTNELSAIQTISLGNCGKYWYGYQFGSIVMDRFHRFATPSAKRLLIGDASRMEGFLATSGGTQGSSSSSVGPFLVIGAGKTNRLAQAMVQNNAWLGRYGDDKGGVAEFGKLFGPGTFQIGGENYGLYYLQGSPSYLIDAFETGVQGHLRAGERAPTAIKGHATDATIATGAYLHLDASAAGTVDADFTWHDANGGPVVATPVGSPVWGSSTNGLATIILYGGVAYELSEDITGVREVFLVFRDTDPGQNRLPPKLLGDYEGVGNFARNTTKDYEYLFASGTAATKWMDAGEVWYDGTRVLPDFCGSFGVQFHVVSVMLYGGTGVVGCLGEAVKNAASDRGKVAFAEVLVYKRTLSDAERRATNKYLRKKWQAADQAFDWDLGSYNVVGGVNSDKLTFEAGTTSIREMKFLASQQTFVKRGEGRLEVSRIANDNLSLTVEQGELAIIRPEAPVVCEMAPDPIAWFDPSDDTSLTDDDNDTTRVKKMIDCRKKNNKMGQMPNAVNTKNWGVDGISPLRVTDTPTGLQALDFGPQATDAASFGGKSSRMAINGYPIMREGFVVWKKKSDSCGAPFSDNSWNFFGVSDSCIIAPGYCLAAAVGGYWTVNGEWVHGAEVSLPKDEYMVVALRPTTGCYCTYLGSQRGSTDSSGACAYGELILYDRILTPEERRNTEAYLMKKWLDKDHPMAKTAMTVPTMTFADGAENTVESDIDLAVQKVVASSGSLTKKGEGAVTVGLVDKSLTDVSVDGGSLTATLRNAADIIADTAYLRFDASQPDTFTTYQKDGTTYVSKVVHPLGDTGHAVANRGVYLRDNQVGSYTKTNDMFLSQTEIGGKVRTVFDFGDYCMATNLTGTTCIDVVGNAAHMTCPWTTLMEAYVVMRERPEAKGNAPIISCWPYSFDRGGDQICGYWCNAIKGDYWMDIDGSTVTRTGKYPEGWHVFSWSAGQGGSLTIPSWGGSLVKDKDWMHLGGQQIAEIIGFAATNTPAVRAAIRDYLQAKWFGVPPTPTPLASLHVAAGASVTLTVTDGSALEVGEITGGGQINANLANVSNIAVTASGRENVSKTTVNGTVSFADEVTVAVTTDATCRLRKGLYPILTATSLQDVDLSTWTVSPKQAGTRSFALEADGTTVYLKVNGPGLAIIVR